MFARLIRHQLGRNKDMGAEPYYYFVKYNADVDAALQELRDQEFQAGRYNPVMRHLSFPIGPDSPSPGARHDSIQEALEASDADGTRSILDLDHVSEQPDFCAVAPLPPEELERLFGTEQPTHEMIEQSGELFEGMERGQGVYIIAYKDGQPDELFFGGYSFD
jgi:hypothetical protein